MFTAGSLEMNTYKVSIKLQGREVGNQTVQATTALNAANQVQAQQSGNQFRMYEVREQ
jgi:hypothetical protein